MQEQTKALIDQLREAWGKATPGDWEKRKSGLDYDIFSVNGEVVSIGNGDRRIGSLYESEADFIVLAHNALPQILNALEDAERRAEAGERLAEKVRKTTESENTRLGNIWKAFMNSPYPKEFLTPMESLSEESQKKLKEYYDALAAYDSAVSPMGNDKQS